MSDLATFAPALVVAAGFVIAVARYAWTHRDPSDYAPKGEAVMYSARYERERSRVLGASGIRAAGGSSSSSDGGGDDGGVSFFPHFDPGSSHGHSSYDSGPSHSHSSSSYDSGSSHSSYDSGSSCGG